MNAGCARPSTYSTVLRDVRAFVGGRDINHNDANLLPCLNITVSVGDLIERISSIDDRAKLTSLHSGFQELDKCVAAASGRQGNDDHDVLFDRRPENQRQVLSSISDIYINN